jgi:hypothetical protein
MFCTTICGSGWSTHLTVQTGPGQVSENRILRLPSPLSVTRPPPSITTRRLVLVTRAVSDIVMVIGALPHLKVKIPPAATSRITASDVQLDGVPFPIT